MKLDTLDKPNEPSGEVGEEGIVSRDGIAKQGAELKPMRMRGGRARDRGPQDVAERSEVEERADDGDPNADAGEVLRDVLRDVEELPEDEDDEDEFSESIEPRCKGCGWSL